MSPYKMSKIESVVRLVLEFNKAFNNHDVSGMTALISDDCSIESSTPAPDGTVYSGKDEITQYWQDFFLESPDANHKIEDIFGLGERCIVQWKFNWSDGAGEKHHVRGADILRVRSGSIIEIQSYVKA